MNKHDLISSHMSLAERLAKKKKRSVNRNVYYEDLESAAYCGLVDAAGKYNDAKGSFPSYAAPRIMGEMDDYLREIYWGARSNRINVCPLDEEMPAKDCSFVDDLFCYVPQKDRDIFVWYYRDGMTLQQIGDKLGMSESAVSKLMSKCRDQLRARKDEITCN